MKRAVTYARVSGDDRGKEDRNLQGQLDMCRQFAIDQGWKIVAELAEDDRGAPGASFELPQLSKVWEMARNQEFDMLVVREIDRLSRKLAKQLIVEEELNRMGVQIAYVLAEYDDSPEGRLNKHIRATIAEYEREKINERMIRGRVLKVKAGHILVHSTTPYGYEIAENEHGKTTLKIFEPEARIVRMIYDWYLNGDETGEKMTIMAIARKLTQMGIPTRLDTTTGRGGTKKNGWAQWSRATVGKILNNQVYAGLWHYRKNYEKEDWLPVEVPAIISEEQWVAARETRIRNKRLANKVRKHKYLLTGHIWCGQCGSHMHGHPVLWKSKNRQGVNLYYRCAGAIGGIVNKKCRLTQFRTEQVDQVVWDWLIEILTNPDTLQMGLENYQIEQEGKRQQVDERLTIISDLLEDKNHQLEQILDLYLSGSFSKDLLIASKSRLETSISALESERDSLLEFLNSTTLQPYQVEQIQEFAQKVTSGIEYATNDFLAKRKIIEWLDVKVFCYLGDGERRVRMSCILSPDNGDVATNIGARNADGSGGSPTRHRWSSGSILRCRSPAAQRDTAARADLPGHGPSGGYPRVPALQSTRHCAVCARQHKYAPRRQQQACHPG